VLPLSENLKHDISTQCMYICGCCVPGAGVASGVQQALDGDQYAELVPRPQSFGLRIIRIIIIMFPTKP
jgi:hypothetical protein